MSEDLNFTIVILGIWAQGNNNFYDSEDEDLNDECSVSGDIHAVEGATAAAMGDAE